MRERFDGLGEGERLAGLRQGWWTRELPEGTEGGWAPPSWTRLKAFGHSSLAALTNYGADMVESAPGTLRLGDMLVASYLVDQSLRRSGAVAALRDFAVDEYRAGLQDDERWTTVGGGVGFMAAVLIDVAMPGPGGETRVATKLTTEGEKLAVKAADEVVEAGGEALARVVDDLADGASRGGPQTLYRIITETTPDGNLLSNAAKGLRPRGPEVRMPNLHTGLSMFDTLEGAATKIPILERGGKTVYGIGEFTFGANVNIEKTLGPGHYTVSGSVEALSNAWARSWIGW